MRQTRVQGTGCGTLVPPWSRRYRYASYPSALNLDGPHGVDLGQPHNVVNVLLESSNAAKVLSTPARRQNRSTLRWTASGIASASGNIGIEGASACRAAWNYGYELGHGLPVLPFAVNADHPAPNGVETESDTYLNFSPSGAGTVPIRGLVPLVRPNAHTHRKSSVPAQEAAGSGTSILRRAWSWADRLEAPRPCGGSFLERLDHPLVLLGVLRPCAEPHVSSATPHLIQERFGGREIAEAFSGCSVINPDDILADIPHMSSKFVEFVPLSHRQGNCIPYAAIRWHDFGNRPALGRPLGHFSRHPDTPLLSLSPRRRFPRPTPERVFVADHQSSSGFSGTGPSAPPPQPIGT